MSLRKGSTGQIDKEKAVDLYIEMRELEIEMNASFQKMIDGSVKDIVKDPDILQHYFLTQYLKVSD